MSKLSSTHISIQRHLFPALEDEIGELSDKERKFVRVIELIEISRFLVGHAWCGVGRKPHSRLSLAKAFIAKAVWNLTTTRALIDLVQSSPSLRRLCGWDTVADIPDESACSRAFALFADIFPLPRQTPLLHPQLLLHLLWTTREMNRAFYFALRLKKKYYGNR